MFIQCCDQLIILHRSSSCLMLIGGAASQWLDTSAHVQELRMDRKEYVVPHLKC